MPSSIQQVSVAGLKSLQPSSMNWQPTGSDSRPIRTCATAVGIVDGVMAAA